MLIKILKDIYTNYDVGPFVGFKGGTAALLFYGLTRFSVDLDFDLLKATEEENVYEGVRNILKNYGVLKEDQNKRFSLFFLLSYADKADKAPNIKIEINKRNFGSRYELKEYLGIPIQVMVQEDMAAHKLVAMYERIGKANRDIFDVWFFLHNNWPINQQIIEQRTHLSYKEFLRACIFALEKLSDRTILSGMGELLTEKQKAWAKAHLRKDTIFLLNLELNKLA